MDIDFSIFMPLGISLSIILGTLLVAWLFRRFFKRFILNSTRIIKNDPTNYMFLNYALSALIYVVGFSWAIITIDSFKAVANSLLAGAGILAAAVGFASQHALSNIISGLFIVIFKPFHINDRITIRDTMSGIVEDITLRHTVIRDFQNRRIVIPNSVISDEVIVNADLTDDRVCKFFEVGISYDADIQLAKRILQEMAEQHPLTLDTRTAEQLAEGIPKVNVKVLQYNESSILLRAWIWAANQGDGFTISCDLFEQLKSRFDAAGIEIPFPHRTLVMKSPVVRSEEVETGDTELPGV